MQVIYEDPVDIQTTTDKTLMSPVKTADIDAKIEEMEKLS